MLIIFSQTQKQINIIEEDNNLSIRNINSSNNIVNKKTSFVIKDVLFHVGSWCLMGTISFFYYSILKKNLKDVSKIKLSNRLRNLQKDPTNTKQIFIDLHNYYKHNNELAKKLDEKIWFNILNYSNQSIQRQIYSQENKDQEDSNVIKAKKKQLSLQLLALLLYYGYDYFEKILKEDVTQKNIKICLNNENKEIEYITQVQKKRDDLVFACYCKISKYYHENKNKTTKTKEIQKDKKKQSYWSNITSFFTKSK